jgi:hydrogenase nickel incorporation protein HypA/HybF
VHELSLSTAIVETATRHAAGRRVSTVRLSIGSLRQVVPDSLDFYFEIVARDTVCEGARLEQERVEALMQCPACRREWDPAPPPLATHEPVAPGIPPLPTFRCPGCDEADTEVVRGGEFEVEWIEVSEAMPVESEPAV